MATQTTNYSAMIDADLVIAAQSGNDQAFSELYTRHRLTCIKVANSILKNADDAEEEVQNSFWNAYKNIERFQHDAKFTTWLNRIVINQCLMRLRSAKRKRAFSIDDVQVGEERGTMELRDTRENPEQSVGRVEVIKVTQTEIRRIPALLRDVLVLRDVEQRSMSEVAESLGITVAAAKSRLLRARRELRSRLDRHFGATGVRSLLAEA
jgi:RNA polymerase sigma-70 factor (ECF subfamily)